MLHQYKLNGYNIVLDTCSGAVHVVDDVAYDMIAMYKEKPLDTVISALIEKYGDRDDVNEEAGSFSRRTILKIWRGRSKRVPVT